MKKADRIPVDGAGDFGANAFAGLHLNGLPTANPQPLAQTPQTTKRQAASLRKRGRVDIRREKTGRGGKWVTVAQGEGFQHTSPQELQTWMKKWKTKCGSGGTLKDKTLELQGDQRAFIAGELEQLGYQVVFVGG